MNAARVKELHETLARAKTGTLMDLLGAVAKPRIVTEPGEQQLVFALTTTLCDRFPAVDHLMDAWWQGQQGGALSQGQALLEACRTAGLDRATQDR